MDKKTEAEKVSGIDTRTDIHDADRSIMVNVSSQLVIYLILVVVYIVLRRRFKLIFSPNPRRKKMHPAYGYDGVLNWMLPVFTTTDIQMININGLDSYVMLSLFRMIATILFLLIVFVAVPLCVVYSLREFNRQEIYYSLCCRNNTEYYTRIATFVAVIVTTVIIMTVLYNYAKAFISLRQAYIRNPATMHPIEFMKRHSVEYVNAASKSVLITRLPGYLENNKDLSDYIAALGLGEQTSAMLVRDTRRYSRLLAKKRSIVLELENEIYRIYAERRSTAVSVLDNSKESGGLTDDQSGSGTISRSGSDGEMNDMSESDREVGQSDKQVGGLSKNDGTSEKDKEMNGQSESDSMSDNDRSAKCTDSAIPIDKKVRLLRALFDDRKYDRLQEILGRLKRNYEDVEEELRMLNEESTVEKNIIEIIQDELYEKNSSNKENIPKDDSFKSMESSRSGSNGKQSMKKRDNDDDRSNDDRSNGDRSNGDRSNGGESIRDGNNVNDDHKNDVNDDNNDDNDENVNDKDNTNNINDENVDEYSPRTEEYDYHLKHGVFNTAFGTGVHYTTRAGIVSFKHQRSASVLCQALISSRLFSCIARPAPAPNDIRYDNINKNAFVVSMQRMVASFLFAVFVFVFFYAVGIIASLLNLKYLERSIPALASFLRAHSGVRATLNGILSPLAYNILMTISPIFIRYIIVLDSNHSGVEDQISLMNRYSIFLFLNGFLSFISTYSLHQLSDLDDMKKILEGFEEGLLKTSVFFTNALIQKALVGQMTILLQVGALITKLFAFIFSGRTLRARKQLEKSIPLDFATAYPNMLLIFAICMTYSLLTPIILVIGFVFYVSCFLVFKSEFIYAVKNETETGGLHFNFAATYVIYILLFFQLSTAIQFLASKEQLLATILFMFTILTFFLKNSLLSSFKRACTYYPLSLQEEHYIDSFTRMLLLSRVKFIRKWTQQTRDEMVELRELGYADTASAMQYERPPDKEGIYLDDAIFDELEQMYE